MTAKTRGRLIRGLALGFALALILSVIWLSGALDRVEYRAFDWRARTFVRPGTASERVALILVDEASLTWAEESNGIGWPWPRELYAVLSSFAARAEVASLSFDILFSDPSSFGVFDDRALSQAFSQVEVPVHAVFLSREAGSDTEWPDSMRPAEISVEGLDSWRSERPRLDLRFPRAEVPNPVLAEGVRWFGNTNLRLPAQRTSGPLTAVDEIFRRAPLFTEFDGRLVPTLGLAPFLATEASDAELRISEGLFELGSTRVPLDPNGYAVLRYTQAEGRHKSYGAAAVIQSELRLLEGAEPVIDPAELRGKHVLVGFSAPGLFDLRPTPIAPAVPGVAVHANLLDNLLSDDFIRIFPQWALILVLVLVTVPTALVSQMLTGAGKTIALYAVAIPLPILASILAYIGGLWLPLVPVELAVILTLVAASLLNYATEGRQKRYIKNAFQQYLSPAVIERLIEHPEQLRLGGESRRLSIFFSDLESFTKISEPLAPGDLTALLNDYLSEMTDIIQDEGGTVDKYEGDAIIAFWNAPIDVPDHARRAVRAALRCQSRLAELAPQFTPRAGRELRMRIGINTGEAVVGNLGSRTRFDYSMLGDAVNLAARLEGVNKEFGTYTMISESTREELSAAEFSARELARVRVVGRNRPVVVYEPFFPEDYRKHASSLDAFENALKLYYEGDLTAAERGFGEIADRDEPARRYAEKCRQTATEGAEQGPDAWDGVWTMTSK